MYISSFCFVRICNIVLSSTTIPFCFFLGTEILETKFVSPERFEVFLAEVTQLTEVSGPIQQAINTLWSTAPKVFGTILNAVMTPLVMFFCLKGLSTQTYVVHQNLTI